MSIPAGSDQWTPQRRRPDRHGDRIRFASPAFRSGRHRAALCALSASPRMCNSPRRMSADTPLQAGGGQRRQAARRSDRWRHRHERARDGSAGIDARSGNSLHRIAPATVRWREDAVVLRGADVDDRRAVPGEPIVFGSGPSLPPATHRTPKPARSSARTSRSSSMREASSGRGSDCAVHARPLRRRCLGGWRRRWRCR